MRKQQIKYNVISTWGLREANKINHFQKAYRISNSFFKIPFQMNKI